MSTMLFPDPRMRSPTALGAFGLTWACNDVDAALSELKGVLDTAKAKGLLITHWFSDDEGDPAALQANAVYQGIVNNNLVIMSDGACQASANEARAAAEHLRAALQGAGIETSPLRPDYQQGQSSLSPLESMKPYIIGGGILVGLIVLAPVIYEAVAVSRTVRKRYSGRRRR